MAQKLNGQQIAGEGEKVDMGSPNRQSDFSDMGVELPPVVGAGTVPEQHFWIGEGRESVLTPVEGAKPDWPPVPNRLYASPAKQSEYPPIPGNVGKVVGAVQRSSGCSRPIAALGILGSLSALAAGDWTVQTLAHDPKPPIFHLLGISESTWRKTTAAQMVWQPHLEADREVETAWRDASALMKDLPSGRWPDSIMPRGASPRLTRGALPVADVKWFLKYGRPCQAQVCDGAAGLLKVAFTQASIRSSLEFHCRTFDGSELSYEVKGNSTEPGAIINYRHQLVVMGSRSELMTVICHPAASDGFAGRCLVAKDDRRPPGQDQPSETDKDILRRYSRAVLAHRRRQDEGSHLERSTWRVPLVIELETDARHRLQEFLETMEVQSDKFREQGALHQASLAGRAAEMAARIAAVLAAGEWYILCPEEAPGPEDVHIGLDEIKTACEVVQFHVGELGRILALEGETEVVAAANKVLDWVREELWHQHRGRTPRHVDEHGHVAITRLINNRIRHGPLRDPDFRTRVIRLLTREHYLGEVPDRRGKFLVHPALGSVERVEEVEGVDEVEHRPPAFPATS